MENIKEKKLDKLQKGIDSLATTMSHVLLHEFFHSNWCGESLLSDARISSLIFTNLTPIEIDVELNDGSRAYGWDGITKLDAATALKNADTYGMS